MHAIVIVEDAVLLAAEKAFVQLSPGSKEAAFTVPLRSVLRDGPPSHWACVPCISPETYQRVEALTRSPGLVGRVSLVASVIGRLKEVWCETLAGLGLTVIDEEIE